MGTVRRLGRITKRGDTYLRRLHPDIPETAGFSRRSIDRAPSEGLTVRPLAVRSPTCSSGT